MVYLLQKEKLLDPVVLRVRQFKEIKDTFSVIRLGVLVELYFLIISKAFRLDHGDLGRLHRCCYQTVNNIMLTRKNVHMYREDSYVEINVV